MCLFFESIKVLNGKPENPGLHEDRMNRTRAEVLQATDKLSLEQIIRTDNKSLQKCRVVYSNKIEKVEILPYFPRKIRFLKLVTADDLDYRYKFLDRTKITRLMSGISTDTDILIVKNRMITDTSFANIIFRDGTSWLTPATPLLAGTKRDQLIRNGSILQADISVKDLHLFKHAVMINAMLGPEDSKPIEISNIF